MYSLVRHGGVRNYLFLAWARGDLEACRDLNLPCADVGDMLLQPLSEQVLYAASRLHEHQAFVDGRAGGASRWLQSPTRKAVTVSTTFC